MERVETTHRAVQLLALDGRREETIGGKGENPLASNYQGPVGRTGEGIAADLAHVPGVPDSQ